MKNFGFSLIELLITLVIIGILAAIAYPIYSTQVIKTHRAQAKVALLDFAAQLEQYHVINHTYENITAPKFPNQSFYYLEVVTATADAFTIRATPIGSQSKDIQCGALTYNQLGEKGITGNGETIECW